MSSSWDWIWEFELRAHDENNAARLRLCALRARAESLSPLQADERLANFEAGRDLARQLKEPWWEQFYNHWIIEVLLHNLKRPQEALALAARANIEIRKPIYDSFPQRCALQLNLVSCYLYLDPIGYETQLREAFAPLEKECAQWSEFECYYAQQWGHFLNDIEDDGALDAAWEYLRLAQIGATAWDLKCALTLLCLVLWRVDETLARQIGGEIAADCEVLAREEDQLDDIAMMQMWQAVSARSEGDEEKAQEFYARAWQTQKRAAAPRNDVHEAAIKFHEIGGEIEKAIEVCDDEIEVLAEHKLKFLEVERRFKKCELLKLAGRDWTSDRALLSAAASELKSRDYWLAKLESLN